MLFAWRYSASTAILFAVLGATALVGPDEASSASLTASWVDNSHGIATTRIERRAATDIAFTAIADVPPGVTMYVDASVSAGSTYCYRAAAYVDYAVSPYTEEVCASTTSDTETITVSKAGTGYGTVTSTPAGISCGTSCSATYPAGTVITLTPTPAAGSVFSGWSGNCSGTGICTVVGNGALVATATFSPEASIPVPRYTLTVAKSGPGNVTSGPAGIACGDDCSEAYAGGTVVTLTATPSGGGTFLGWSGGGCSSSAATCVVTVTSAVSVSGKFKGGSSRGHGK